MIKDNQKLFNRFHVLLDAFIIVISFILTYQIRFDSFISYNLEFLRPYAYWGPLNYYSRMLIYIVPAYLLFYYGCHVYDTKRSKSTRHEIWDIFKANLAGITYFTFVLVMSKKSMTYMRAFLVIFFLVNLILNYVMRFALKAILRFYRKKGFN